MDGSRCAMQAKPVIFSKRANDDGIEPGDVVTPIENCSKFLGSTEDMLHVFDTVERGSLILVLAMLDDYTMIVLHCTNVWKCSAYNIDIVAYA